MVYVSHKVGLLFPLCETFKECQREANLSNIHLDTMQVAQNMVETD